IPFEETSSIVNLFSKELGRIKIVIKQSGRKRLQSYSQLLGVEAVVIQSDKELWKCRDCVIVRSYPHLRTSLDRLQTAAHSAALLAKLLPLCLPLAPIYALFLEFLEQIPHFTYPHVALAAFLAKFCVHEGLFPSEELKTPQEMSEYMLLACKDLRELKAESVDRKLTLKLTHFLLG
ncbi:MAG: recombination protein O N-terminal domain-containing protein, partial [Verrucomicrobia bacterium]|nr:recombination protein O N-terminal domain-containing protein [Verrucomicrobiota bacterium]